MKDGFHRFSKGHGELVVLGLLTRNAMHGYQIVRSLCEEEGKILYVLCMGEGTLYPLLYRLEKKQLIRGRWAKAGKKRQLRQYHITRKGRVEYRRLRRCWTALTAAVEKICGGTGSSRRFKPGRLMAGAK